MKISEDDKRAYWICAKYIILIIALDNIIGYLDTVIKGILS